MASQHQIDIEIQQNHKHNFTVNFLDGTMFWFGVSFFAYRTILPVYISNLTESEFVIALLSMLLATGWLLPQLFTANWVQRLPFKKYGPVNVGLWTERLPILLLAPAAWLATISKELSLILSLIIIAWHIIGVVLLSPKRSSWIWRALTTCSRKVALSLPLSSARSSRYGTGGTSMWISIRSISGPLIRARYLSIW